MSLHEFWQQVWAYVAHLGAWGPAVFIPTHMACTLVFVPTALLALAAGALFGTALGSVLVFSAAALSQAGVFLVGRYFSRGWLLGRISHNDRFKALDEMVAVQGWKIVLLLRFSAIFPFTFLNYGLGLTKISFKDYFTASCLGSIPGTVLYVYLGALAHGVAAQHAKINLLQWVLMVVGLASTITIGVLTARIVKNELEAHSGR